MKKRLQHIAPLQLGIVLATLCGALLAVPVTWASEAPKDKPKSDKPTPAGEEYRAIMRELNEMEAAFRGAKTEEEMVKVQAAYRGKEANLNFGARFLELARKYPKDPAAIDSLGFLVVTLVCPESSTAVDILIKDHIQSAALGQVSQRMAGYWPKLGPIHEKLLRAMLEKSPHREAQGQASLSLALHLKSKAELARKLKAGGEPAAYLQKYWSLNAEEVRQLTELDLGKLSQEEENLCRTILEKYADVPRNKRTLGDIARAEFSERGGNLDIGKPAPQIEGEDLDGEKFKLSDYRGKVVVLSFWGTWCGPCMALVPHERSLVKRLEGKPFVFLGINSDSTKKGLKEGMKKHEMTWRNWWDGGGLEGPIATKYNVSSWPTIYVLDPKGVIRYKNVRGEELDKAVDALLKEL